MFSLKKKRIVQYSLNLSNFRSVKFTCTELFRFSSTLDWRFADTAPSTC